MYFLTIWLRTEDSDEQIRQFSKVMKQNIKDYCRSEELETKISSSRRRITSSLQCDNLEYKCIETENNIEKICEAVEVKINRSTKAKAKCNQD